MTREEAIEIINRNCTEGSKLREACAMFIPELNGSEDERIRKWIKKEIEDKYVVEGIVNNKLADEAFGWLEKQKHLYETTKDRFYSEGFEEGQLYERQKESLHISETCKENANSFTDEDEKIREELIALVVWAQTFSASAITKEEANVMKAYLEKRKDANKAIEAVDRIDKYIKYIRVHTANAHNMNDSNPDKKYYIGVDDTLSNIAGILNGVYSEEKQKEQKPILEVFGFKVGDAVRLKDGDGRKHIIKSFEEVEGLHGPNFYRAVFEDNAVDYIFIGDKYSNGYYTQMEKIENQKEQNSEDEEDNDFTIYHPLKNGKGEYECIPYSFYGSLTSFSEDKDLIGFLRTCFYTKEECNKWIDKQKEQKPTEYLDNELNTRK